MPSNARSGTIVAALAAAIGIVLASCGGDDGSDHGATPTPTPASTPSATPGATPTAQPGPLVLASGIVADLPPAVAWGTNRYLVAFSAVAERPEADVLAVRLDAAGAAVDPSPLLLSDLGAGAFLSDATAEYESPAIAFDGAVFGVFYRGFGTAEQFGGAPGEAIGFTALPVAGEPIVPGTQIASQANVGMVTSFLVPPLAAAEVAGSFAGLYQNVLQGIGTPRLPSVLGDFVSVADGTVVAQDPFTLLSAVPPFDRFILTGSAPGAAANGTLALGAWVETLAEIATQERQASLSGALLAPGATPVPVRLSTTVIGSEGVAIASDGSDFLVVWSATSADGAGTLDEIRGIRFRPDTGALDADGGFVVAGGASAKALGGVAFGGGTYLVVWADGATVRGARVGTDGTVGAAFTIDDGPAAPPAVASDGERFLVVFARSSGTDSGDLLGTFVAPE